MNYRLSDIVGYFKMLSENHPDLLHDDATGSRVFEVVAYEEAFSDFKTAGQAKTYFVRFILPTMRMEDVGDNARKVYQFGFMVGQYYSRRESDRETMVTAWTNAERVADEFLMRMVADSRNGYPLFGGNFDKLQKAELNGDFWAVQGDGSYCAVLYMLDLAVFRCLESDEWPEWTDGGLTTF